MYKIIGADGKEYGPITAEQLRQWIAEGRASMQTQVLPDGATEWKTVGQLPEFAGLAPGPVPVISAIPTPTPAGADQVNGPAIGLIVVAILTAFAQIVSLVFRVVGTSFMASNRMPSQAWPAMLTGPIGIVLSIIGLVMCVVILLGAMKMKLENYGLAMAASILAMVPCSLCCVIGLPIGIWALVVLLKPEVKSAFH